MSFRLHVVLVHPIYASNVGFSARVSANMGVDNFIVISNKNLHLEDNAKKRAAGAQERLKNILVYKDWDSFYKEQGEGLRIAFTRRGGKNRPVPLLNDLINESFLQDLAAEDAKDIYLFFGPEDDGLSAEDLKLIQIHAQLPIYGEMASFNLAHAVLLSTYILQNKLQKPLKIEEPTSVNSIEASDFSLQYSDQALKRWLECLGMENSNSNKSAFQAINKMILRSIPTKRELSIWHNVLHSTVRLLKNVTEKDRRQR